MMIHRRRFPPPTICIPVVIVSSFSLCCLNVLVGTFWQSNDGCFLALAVFLLNDDLLDGTSSIITCGGGRGWWWGWRGGEGGGAAPRLLLHRLRGAWHRTLLAHLQNYNFSGLKSFIWEISPRLFNLISRKEVRNSLKSIYLSAII